MFGKENNLKSGEIVAKFIKIDIKIHENTKRKLSEF